MPTTSAAVLDDIDRQILELLSRDGRATVRDIARAVSLSPAPVRRRIDRLETAGVIVGYTVRLDRAKMGSALEAVTELRFSGNTKMEDIVRFATTLPEVHEVLTVAGDPDALVRIRVDSVAHLQSVVNALRSGGAVIGTKTLIVLESWQRAEVSP